MKKLIAFGFAVVAAFSSFAGAAGSPFAEARWLWPAELGKDVRNTTVEFRRTFAAGKAGPARLAIAADTVYAVRLNGAFVHTQRFPDVPPQRFYDVLDLPSVKTGENELIVSLYVQGINTFQTLPGDPGLMFRIFGDGLSVPSDAATAWRRSTRNRADGVPLVTGQLGYSFEYDALAAEENWKPLASADAVRGADAFDLSERPVPRVRILPEVREKIIAQGRLDGSPVPDVPAPGMDRTAMTPVSTAAFFEPDGWHVRPELFAGGIYVLVDLGREEAGLLSLDVETDAGAVIDIGHAEHMENLRIRTEIDKRNFCGRYRAREGRQTFCRWQRRMAGRYIQIHVRGAKTRFALHRLSLKPVELPLPNRLVPNFADPRMTEIWRTGVRTLALCMHEHYEDCPWREQALYGNDARNQMLAGYYAFGKDWPMPAFALELHARGLGKDGWLEMCMPAKIRITIPSFTFNWVMSLGDHLKYVGDTAFLLRVLPTAKAILDRRLAEMKDGLLPCPAGDRYWQFYEWRPGLDGAVYVKDGETRFESILNLDFILALEAGASCAKAVGDAATAERWRAAARTARAAVKARFWDSAKREFRLADEASSSVAELTQALALLAGCVPEEAKGIVAEKLSRPSEWTEVSLSQTLYKYEALIAAGSETAKRAVAQMTDLWQSMLDRGATSFWETTDGWTDFGAAGSLCHGWSAVPVYIVGAHPELVPLANRSSFDSL